MKRNNNRQNSNITPYRRDAYVQGNTVRKLAPKEDQRRVREERRQDAVRQNHSRLQKNETLNLGYSLFLIAIAVGMLYVCGHYLNLQSQNVTSMKEIAEKEALLDEMTQQNNDEYNRVMTSVNLDEVKDIAMNKLGMVYAAENQIVVFDGSVKDYVKQYEEIPETSDSLLEEILALK